MELNLREELILSQIINNCYYREKVLSNIKPVYFENADNNKLFKTITKLLDEKVVVLERNILRLNFHDTEKIDYILSLEFHNENIDNLIKETETWCQTRALEINILKSADIIAEGKDRTIIPTLMNEALSVSFDKDLGIDYTNDLESRFLRYDPSLERKIPTKYQMLDYYTNGGLSEKTLVVFLGASNLGKSLMMCNVICNMVNQGYNGVYLTLELSKEVIGRRCDSINTQLPYFNLFKLKDQAIKKLSKMKLGHLFIKEYPSSKASCVNIRSYLKELEIYKKFKPDFIVVDSLNLMKTNSSMDINNMYNYYGRITIELRELAIELGIPIITAIHVGRQAYGSANVGQEDVRGSLAIMEFSDVGISLSQTSDQEPENLITWKLVKNRLGRKNGKLETRFDNETLKVSEILTSEDREKLEGEKNFNSIPIEDKKTEVEEGLSSLDDLLTDKSFSDFS